jgi:Ca2+-binding RTX toxin-like protein
MRGLTRAMIAVGAVLVGLICAPLAHGAAGDLYVTSNDASPTTSTILRFNPSVAGFTTFATTLEGASFLNFGPSGDLYATNEDHSGVLKVDRSGTVSTITNIDSAYGIAREPSGTLVVGDYTGMANGGLTRVDPASGAKQLLTPEVPLGAAFYGVAAAPDGTIYAAQNGAGNLLRLPPGGTPSVFAEQLIDPIDVEVDIDGTLLVTDQGTNPDTLDRVNPTTGAITPVATVATSVRLYGLTRGVDGFIYAADIGTPDTVLRIDPKTGASTEVFRDPVLITAVDVEAEPPDCHGQLATIYGTPGDDTIVGGPFADVIAGLGGNDKISGLASGDVLCGGPGKDTLKGGGGKDRLYGDIGKDLLKGGKGKDRLIGGSGRDRCPGHSRDTRKSC